PESLVEAERLDLALAEPHQMGFVVASLSSRLCQSEVPTAAVRWGLDRALRRHFGLQPRIDLEGVALENLATAGVVEPRRSIDVALGIIEVEPGLRVDALDCAHHLRGEQDVVDWHHFGEQIDAGLMIDAGIEEDVVPDDLAELRAPVVEREPAEPPPVKRHGAAAMRDNQLQRREILEQVGEDE